MRLAVRLAVRGKTKCNERACIWPCIFNTLDGGFEGAKGLKTYKNRVKKQD